MNFRFEDSQEFNPDYQKENNLIDTNQSTYINDTDYKIEKILKGQIKFFIDEGASEEFVMSPPIDPVKSGEESEIGVESLFQIEPPVIPKPIFKVNTNENLFTNACSGQNENEIIKVDNNLKRRFEYKRKRFQNADNILKKIMTAFINTYLLNALNTKIRKTGNKTYFGKVPQDFIKDLVNKSNRKNIVELTLKQLFEKWDLYSRELNNLEKDKNFEVDNILNSSYLNLYKLYINSDEFKIKEMDRLKRKKMNDWYINTYRNLSNDFINY